MEKADIKDYYVGKICTVFESMYLPQNKKARLALEAASTEDEKRF